MTTSPETSPEQPFSPRIFTPHTFSLHASSLQTSSSHANGGAPRPVAPAYEDFWLASTLNPANTPAFSERVYNYERPEVPPPYLRSGTPIPLSRPADSPNSNAPSGHNHNTAQRCAALNHLLGLRHSTTEFGNGPITFAQLSDILFAIGAMPHSAGAGWGHPSAGNLRPVQTSVFCVNVHDEDNNQFNGTFQYDAERHTLTSVGPCPDYETLKPAVGGFGANTPAAVFVVWAHPEQMLAKYGERGGRFVLLEAGAVMQSIGLSVAAVGLGACVMGGSQDGQLVNLLGLQTLRGVQIAFTMLIGRPSGLIGQPSG